MGIGDLRNEPRSLRMGVSIVELNVLDINFVFFHNSSHYKLTGGGGGRRWFIVLDIILAPVDRIM